MFWDAVIWGIGISLGMNVGLFVTVFVISAAKKLSGGNKLTQDDVNKQSLAALVRRNEIGEGMSDSLRRLADAADAIEDSKFWSKRGE